MSDQDRIELMRVLERVRIVYSKSLNLETSMSSMISNMKYNITFDDKSPYEDDLNNMKDEVTKANAALSGDVIPNLINRINS